MNEEIDIYADVDKIHNLQVSFFILNQIKSLFSTIMKMDIRSRLRWYRSTLAIWLGGPRIMIWSSKLERME